MKLDKNQTKANEAVNLRIKISGNGNLKLADVQDLELPSDLESYDPKITENFKASAGGVSGTKVIDYLIIPRLEGEYEIPQLSFSYYSLSKKQYVSKKAGPFILKVEKGNGTQATISPGRTEKSDFRILGNDIRYIKSNPPDFKENVNISFGSPLFYAFSISPFLIFGAFTFFIRRREKMLGNTTQLRMRNATGVATKRLSLAKKHLGTPKEELVFEEILKALWGYIGDKFLIPQAALNKEKVSEILAGKMFLKNSFNCSTEILMNVRWRVMRGSAMGIKAETVYASAAKVITGIEEKIKA
ncbi:MAG: BatD family protein [Bacteroidetes bacterium]|nr:BatD family protein [Bacteroidota bacterium]